MGIINLLFIIGNRGEYILPNVKNFPIVPNFCKSTYCYKLTWGNLETQEVVILVLAEIQKQSCPLFYN